MICCLKFCCSSVESTSVLLATIIKGFPGKRFLIFSTSVFTCAKVRFSFLILLASKRYITNCACSIFWKVFLIPKPSISSVVSRIPAVSINRNPTPPIEISSSMVSRVVPAISLTIALSSFKSAFNKVDFPTFGSPTMATGIPFLSTFPTAKESISLFKTF